MTDFNINSTRFWIGFCSVIAQCFVSLIGIVLMPLRGKPAYKYVIQTMVAFAVGALLGSAILHLIPESVGTHDHGHHESDHDAQKTGEDPLLNNPPLHINTTGLVNTKSQQDISFYHQHGDDEALHRHRRQTKLLLNKMSASDEATKLGEQEAAHHHTLHTRDHTSMYRMLATLAAVLIFFTYHSLTHQHEHRAHEERLAASRRQVATHSGEIINLTQLATCQKPQRHGKNNQVCPTLSDCQLPKGFSPQAVTKTTFRSIPRRAYMVLLGDAIHNFADGVATAAAFAASTEQGITTSVAIVCHEAAHEVGDFAILLHSGLSFSGALCLNFLSSMSAILGYITGAIVVGSVNHQDSFILWILALTAGIFLYIALVDMLPELIEQQDGRLVLFAVQLVAIGAGIAVVFTVRACCKSLRQLKEEGR